MTAPALTLLVPCFNAARFLPRLAQHVRALTVPFADILCYDDGSTDDTVAVARSLGWRMLTPNANSGVAAARNRLAAAATTDWIHFHDADDRLDPRFVEKLAPFCDAAHDVVSCDADWIDDDARGALQIAWRYDPAALAADPHRALLRTAMGLNNSIIRRAAWADVGGCDESLAIWEDADIHIRLARAGARWHHVPEVLTWSLRRPDSFSHDYARGWRCRLAALEKYAAEPAAALVAAELAAESERAAAELAALRANADARRAVALCRRLGGDPPTTAHPLFRLLKPLLPATTLLRWQQQRRQATKSA
jgi:glycosyltransferase involved in cell wall biosynthesis